MHYSATSWPAAIGLALLVLIFAAVSAAASTIASPAERSRWRAGGLSLRLGTLRPGRLVLLPVLTPLVRGLDVLSGRGAGRVPARAPRAGRRRWRQFLALHQTRIVRANSWVEAGRHRGPAGADVTLLFSRHPRLHHAVRRRASPEEVIDLLNRYFLAAGSRSSSKHKRLRLDKFHRRTASWRSGGAPLDRTPTTRRHAVGLRARNGRHAAGVQARSWAEGAGRLRCRHRHPFRPGGGSGLMGSQRRQEYTAIGGHGEPGEPGFEGLTKEAGCPHPRIA